KRAELCLFLCGAEGPEASGTKDSNTAWLRLLLSGSLGLAEAYMAGEVDSPDLTTFLVIMLLAENRAATAWTKRTTYGAFFRWSVVFGPALLLLRKAHGVAAARLNAVRHYSLSNALFSAFRDETMTYSCPLWREPVGGPAATQDGPEKTVDRHDADGDGGGDDDDTLEEAQERKLRHIVRAARIKSTEHVLEVSGGWGSFAILAARETGCRVATITPSEEQTPLMIRERVAAAVSSLSPGQVRVLVCDYRDVLSALAATTKPAATKFDKIVSIEMLEHVGHECLETYFRCVDRYLQDGPEGIAAFRSITMSDAHYDAYLRGAGGVGSRKTRGGMSKEEIEVFRRKWVYYFASGEAAFRTKSIGDVIITVGRDGCVEFLQDPLQNASP
ncbi:uncharacterized protein PG986_008925, partial [Apiospora aurea]